MTALAPFPPIIRRRLSDYVAQRRRLRVVRALLFAAVWLAGWLLACCIADRFLAFPSWLRAVLLSTGAGGVLWIIAPPMLGLFRRRVDWVGASEELEARYPALGQRLVTLTSQLLSPAPYRGSQQFLGVLADELSDQLAANQSSRFAAWSAAFRPLLALAALGIIWTALGSVEWLNLSQLLRRQVMPLSPIAPVTTTSIELWPAGIVDVKERESLSIKAVARHLSGGGSPILYFSARGDDWESIPMAAGPENSWTAALSGIDRDQRIYVKAGDAKTAMTQIRVLRKPAIAEFRLRYSYPAYTGRAILNVGPRDGACARFLRERQIALFIDEPNAIIGADVLKRAVANRAALNEIAVRGWDICKRDHEIGAVSRRMAAFLAGLATGEGR